MSFFGKLTTRERYGVRLALRLGETFSKKEPASLAKISKDEDISMKYLEQLIVPFKKEGWLESVRGREGGYIMKKDPAQITLKDIIWIIDDEPKLVRCLHEKGHDCKLSPKCRAKHAWIRVQKAIEDSLESIRLDELIKG